MARWGIVMWIGLGLVVGCGDKDNASNPPVSDTTVVNDTVDAVTDAPSTVSDIPAAPSDTTETDTVPAPTDAEPPNTDSPPPEPDAVPCAPDCEDKFCGDDGCGGTCGDCTVLEVCSNVWQCIPIGALQCEEANKPSGGCALNDDLCFCVGCQNDGECEPANDDCVCPDCTTDSVCSDSGNCNSNGICDPWLEGCGCADCTLHPTCLNIPIQNVDFVQWIDATVATFPGPATEGFVVPTPAELNAFATLANAMLAEDWGVAKTAAEAVQYELVQITDNQVAGDLFYGALPATGNTTGRGLYFVRPQSLALRPLVIESPHAVFDSRTGVVSAEIFRAVRPRVFFMSGTHRCSNGAESGCSGTTGVCGTSSAPYKESDMAHTATAFFQIFHQRAALQDNPSLTTLQIHGFASKDTDPEFTFSNGTTTDAETALSNTLAEALEIQLAPFENAKPGNSCNRIGDINRLCGSTNTQGRFTNGVDPSLVCTTAASESANRFAHMEFSYDLRHPGGGLEPTLIIEAIQAVFP